MPLDEKALAEVNALSAASKASMGHVVAPLQAEATTALHAAEPKSYLDVGLGLVIKDHQLERHVAEAAKTGAIFFGGKVGLASTVALYALDQIKVGDSFGQSCLDGGLGIAKGTALRGINALAAARDFGIARQTLSLGLGARVLDSGLNRHTWTDDKTHSFSFDKGSRTMLEAAKDKQALMADVGAFAVGGVLSGGINKFAENSLRSNPFWRTTITGGAFGLATGSTGEIMRQRNQGESFNLTKIVSAGGKQAIYSAIAAAPAGLQAKSALRNSFYDSFGVKTIGEKGSYRYLYRLDGDVHEVLRTDASVKGLKVAKDQLAAISAQKQLGLANSFGVSFAKAGEAVSFQSDGGQTNATARAPRLNELAVMEQVLARSQPGQLTVDGKSGVKFNFLRDQEVVSLHADGLFEARGQSPNIFLHNELLQDKPLTEREPDRMPDESQDYYKRRHSLEGTATHEIAHNSDTKVREAFPDLAERLRENLGWVRFQDGKLDFDTHLLKDKDGNLFRFSNNHTWVRSDPAGKPLDAQGQPAAPGKEQRLTNYEMMVNSQVKPASDYFNNPTEMLMEGFKDYRVGGASRAQLLSSSPKLYEQVRIQDDAELALHYGQDASGQALMVRLPDGTLAKRDSQSLAAIAKFEEESRARPPLPFGIQPFGR